MVDRYLKLTWSISHQEYKDKGFQYLPEGYQTKTAEDISKMDFECDLIFVCFDSGNARLFTMDRWGRVRENTSDAFCVIGSGGALALAQLYAREYGQYTPLSEGLYTVFEAKRKAEADASVGPDTHLMVADPNDIIFVDPYAGLDFLQREFEKRHAPIEGIQLPEYFFQIEDDYEGMIKPYTGGNAEADDSGTTPGEGGNKPKSEFEAFDALATKLLKVPKSAIQDKSKKPDVCMLFCAQQAYWVEF